MITIFGTTYFTIGAGFVVLVVAAPFLFWFSRWLWRPNVEDKPPGVRSLAIGGTTLALLLLLAVGLFWDVYLIGQRAKALCQETGLVVNRKAEAEGFLGDVNIQYWSQHGFKFVEYQLNGEIVRVVLDDGKPRITRVDAPASRFGLISNSSVLNSSTDDFIDHHFRHHVAQVVDRATGEVLGQLSEYTVHPGWVDRATISITGFSFVPWRCSRTSQGNIALGRESVRLNERDLLRAVLTPQR